MFITSGNEDLDAEESDHLSIGADWSVTEAWKVSVDYWMIKNDDAVRSSPQASSAFEGITTRIPGMWVNIDSPHWL